MSDRREFTIRLDPADWRALKIEALDEGTSMQAIVTRLIRRHLAEKAKK